MAEQMYEVIVDKYVGKHKIYSKGQPVPESEIIGGEEGKKLALEGQKGLTRKYHDEKEPRKLKDVPIKLKKITSSKAGK